MKKYDSIVIGAGNSGLVSALRLVKSGKKVLVLESNSLPGGFATSFTRGRFEFETSLNGLLDYGTKENPGTIFSLFQDFGIEDKISFSRVPEAYHVYSLNTNEDYKMPFGIPNFIEQLEEYVPNSRNSVENFFELALECRNAMQYITQNSENVDESILLQEYPQFFKVCEGSVSKVLDSLHVPSKAQEIITSYWTYFGSPSSALSFAHFASIFYTFIEKGILIPKKTSHDISLTLAEEIEKGKGEIKYLSTVKSILFEEEKIAGVCLTNGKKYYADHIICAISPTKVYGTMIPSNKLPVKATKLTNSRVLGLRGFSIYLGLNQSAKDLGLNDYAYFIYHSLDSNKEYELMNSLQNTSSVAVVMNNADPSCSFKGTCILKITSFFSGDDLSKSLTYENYFAWKEKYAACIIDAFEDATGILIKPYIEEIEIASPVTFARYSQHPGGVICGYKATGLDNLLPRIANETNENYIPNLRFCGGFSTYMAGYHSTYLSGNRAAFQTLEDMKGGDMDE